MLFITTIKRQPNLDVSSSTCMTGDTYGFTHQKMKCADGHQWVLKRHQQFSDRATWDYSWTSSYWCGCLDIWATISSSPTSTSSSWFTLPLLFIYFTESDISNDHTSILGLSHWSVHPALIWLLLEHTHPDQDDPIQWSKNRATTS